MLSDRTCANCGAEIRVTIFRGMNYCSENCRKVLAGELPKENDGNDR